jgi:hypothetical protein
MTATGLQQFLDVSLDATRVVLTDIFIHNENPSIGTISAQELLEPSVETVVKIAEDTLRDDHRNSSLALNFQEPRRWLPAEETPATGSSATEV